MKTYKHRSLSKTQIYQQVYVLIRKPDLLYVYLLSLYSITIEVYRDINLVYHIFQRRHISIAGYPNLWCNNKSISYYCIFYHDRGL